MRDITSTLLYQWFNEVWNENREDSIDKLMATASYAHGIIAPDQQTPTAPLFFQVPVKALHQNIFLPTLHG
jgi:hypothetical protein